MRSIFARYLAYTVVILLPVQSINVVSFARCINIKNIYSPCVCILFISFNFQLLKSKLTNANILCLVRFRLEQMSAVTDTVPEQRWLDRTITSFRVYITCICVSRCVFVTDLDDAHLYLARAKPHSNPLDFRINAFYFVPSTLHAASISRPQQSPFAVTPANDSAQFDDAEL